MRDGDLAAYQLAIDEARDLVAEAAEAAGQEADGATTTSTTATSSTTTIRRLRLAPAGFLGASGSPRPETAKRSGVTGRCA